MKYYRVHTADVAWITKQPRGIFTAISKLVDAKTMNEEEIATYWKNRAYFEEVLPVPPFYEAGNPDGAVTWFKDTPEGNDIWAQMTFYRGMAGKYGLKLYRSECEELPGEVIYEDAFQIAVKDPKLEVEIVTKELDLRLDRLFAEGKLVSPDYKNCIANLPNSILKKFGIKTVGPTLPQLDTYLERDYKNIVVLLLDGMGTKIMERHLSPDGAFCSHLKCTYNSTFLSTTTAATTSVLSGLQPCEHGWLGWDCYYPSIDKNVTVFLNLEQITEVPVADYNVAQTVTPYVNIVDRICESGQKAYLIAPFADPSLQSIDDICREIRQRCEQPEPKYVYAYWNQPDGLLHRHGGGTQIVLDAMAHMERVVSELAQELEDTLFIVTTDHGHLDTDSVMLADYPELCDCLVRWPSLEPRALNFFVKEEKKEFFVQEFNRLFGDMFILMPMEEVIERQLMGTGTPHPEFRGMLGDYLAIAITDLTIYFTEERWLSMHGSLTEDEMKIPLIVL